MTNCDCYGDIMCDYHEGEAREASDSLRRAKTAARRQLALAELKGAAKTLLSLGLSVYQIAEECREVAREAEDELFDEEAVRCGASAYNR